MTNVDGPPGQTSPFDFLKKWADANPQQAAVLLAGIACFATVAIILRFGVGLQDSVKNVYIVMGVGVSLLVVTRILNNNLMANVLTGFVLVMGLAWIVAFLTFRAGFGDPVTHQRIGCVVYLWEECNVTADYLGKKDAPKIKVSDFSEITQSLPSSPAPDLSVTVQFAGTIDRDAVRSMMMGLAAKNWKMLGTIGGGERTGAAAGYAEVRYSGNNKAAAEALAKAVSAYGIAGRPLKAVTNPDVKSSELEVWISN